MTKLNVFYSQLWCKCTETRYLTVIPACIRPVISFELKWPSFLLVIENHVGINENTKRPCQWNNVSRSPQLCRKNKGRWWQHFLMATGAGPVASLTSLRRTTVDMVFWIANPLYNSCAIYIGTAKCNGYRKWRYKTEINLTFMRWFLAIDQEPYPLGTKALSCVSQVAVTSAQLPSVDNGGWNAGRRFLQASSAILLKVKPDQLNVLNLWTYNFGIKDNFEQDGEYSLYIQASKV